MTIDEKKSKLTKIYAKLDEAWAAGDMVNEKYVIGSIWTYRKFFQDECGKGIDAVLHAFLASLNADEFAFRILGSQLEDPNQIPLFT